MFVYEKKLQYPINIKNTNPKLAALIISQYGGPYCHKLHLRKQFLEHKFKLKNTIFSIRAKVWCSFLLI